MIDLYLISPYSHHEPAVRTHRFLDACRAAAWLMDKGLVVFSPIAYGHHLCRLCDLPYTWEAWERVDHAFIDSCRAVIVLMIPGWRSSAGVKAEIAYARQTGKPVWWMLPIQGGYSVHRQCPEPLPLRLAA